MAGLRAPEFGPGCIPIVRQALAELIAQDERAHGQQRGSVRGRLLRRSQAAVGGRVIRLLRGQQRL